MPMSKNIVKFVTGINFRLTSISVLILALLSWVMYGFILKAEHETNQSMDQLISDSQKTAWEKIISLEVNSLNEQLPSLARDRDLMKGLKKGDNDVVKDNAGSTFNRLEASKLINHMLIFNAKNALVFSSSMANATPNVKLTVEQVKKNKKPTSGFSQQKNGLSLSSVLPLIRRGKVVGEVMLAKNVSVLLKDFKQGFHTELAIVDLDGQLGATTNKALFSHILQSHDSAILKQRQTINYKQQYYKTSTLPLKGYNDKPVAYLLAAKDLSVMINKQHTLNALSLKRSIITVIILALCLSIYLRFLVISPIKRAKEFSAKIASGDFSVADSSCAKRRDELGELFQTLHLMRDDLGQRHQRDQALASQLAAAARVVAQSVQVISEGNEKLKSQTLTQADSIEETSKQVGSVSDYLSDNASQAKSLLNVVDGSKQKSALANDQFKHLAQAMNNIIESSEQISNFIEVINDISLKTNLLALNASVEAAHAGEHGKGFEVVANEVRVLAVSAANSAKEITREIKASMTHITEGSELIEQTKANFSSINDDVLHVNDVFSQLSRTTAEQSTSVAEINLAIQTLAELTQEKSALVETLSTSAKELNTQSDDMMAFVREVSSTQNSND